MFTTEEMMLLKSCLLAQKKVFTFSECATYTGISESYLYKLTAKNVIPYSKPNGKMIFFEREKIEQWLLQNPNETQKETIQKNAPVSELRKKLM